MTDDSDKAGHRLLAVIRGNDDLRRAVAGWLTQIGMTRAELDVQADLADGYSGKLLGSKAIKRFSNKALWRVLAAAGLALILVEDSDAAVPSQPSSQAPDARPHWRSTKGSSWGRRMAALRADKLTAARRQEIGRMGARARWRK